MKRAPVAVGLDVLRELVEVKTPRILKDLPDGGQDWQVQRALFARAGFMDAARAAAQAADVTLVDGGRVGGGVMLTLQQAIIRRCVSWSTYVV